MIKNRWTSVNILSCIINNLFSRMSINNDKAWELTNAVFAFAFLFFELVIKWNWVPWHFNNVSVIMALLSVVSHKNYLKQVFCFIFWFWWHVKFIFNIFGEKSAWRCPVSSKIKPDVFAFCLEAFVPVVNFHWLNCSVFSSFI